MTLRDAYALLGGDLEGVLSRLGGDSALLMKHLEQLAGDSAWQEVREAVAAKDQAGIWRAAHTVQGTCRTLGLEQLARTAERVMAADTPSETGMAMAWLEREHALTAAVLAQLEHSGMAMAMMIHELRTPLQAIVSAAETAGIGRITLAARHMSALLSGIHGLAAAGPPRRDPFSPAGVMRMAAKMFEGAAGGEQPGVSVRTDLRHERVLGDPTRLTQVLLNLLTNAARSTTANDTIRLEATEVDDSIAITVTDHGVGMSEAERQCAYKPGWRGLSGGSMGLGLTIVRRLVARMGGEMAIDSAPGEGTTVTVRLPLLLSDAVEVPKEPVEHQRRFSHLRVLLAEDDRLNAEASAELLTGLGLRTSIARDGVEAARLACAGGYDCVFLDAHMPGPDGCSTVAHIRQALPGVPIFGLTAGLLPGEEKRFRAAGMRECLLKPVGMEKLARLLGDYFPDR